MYRDENRDTYLFVCLELKEGSPKGLVLFSLCVMFFSNNVYKFMGLCKYKKGRRFLKRKF